MIKRLQELAIANGDQLTVIPIKYLDKLQFFLKNYENDNELNPFQSMIIKDLYNFQLPKTEFSINSIILVAVYRPFYAKINFNYSDKNYSFLSFVSSDYKKMEKYLKIHLKLDNHKMKKAKRLPLKRLAVHSGLAKYGRNNITYINGLGSNFSYYAYFSDIKNESFKWSTDINLKMCDNCDLCRKICPTKAIEKEIFLINNMKCLSYFNEELGEIPKWIDNKIHHTLYNCLRCQEICPANFGQEKTIINDLKFNHNETVSLLSGKDFNEFSDDLKRKAKIIGIDDWYEVIPRNLKLLLDEANKSKTYYE